MCIGARSIIRHSPSFASHSSCSAGSSSCSSEFRALGKAAASSLGFFSNIVDWREAGYFDIRSHQKWLLHTWSLSVEWQFYLLYPLGLLLVHKLFGQRGMVRAVIFVALASFALCVYLSDPTKWPTAAFYLLPTRAWELLVGGLACLIPFNDKAHPRRDGACRACNDHVRRDRLQRTG